MHLVSFSKWCGWVSGVHVISSSNNEVTYYLVNIFGSLELPWLTYPNWPALSNTYTIFRTFHTRNWELHIHNTRQRDIRLIHPNFESNKNCFRFFLPKLLTELPGELLESLYNVSIKTFSNHIKKYFIDQYWSVCTKSPCQPCGRLPLWVKNCLT